MSKFSWIQLKIFFIDAFEKIFFFLYLSLCDWSKKSIHVVEVIKKVLMKKLLNLKYNDLKIFSDIATVKLVRFVIRGFSYSRALWMSRLAF